MSTRMYSVYVEPDGEVLWSHLAIGPLQALNLFRFAHNIANGVIEWDESAQCQCLVDDKLVYGVKLDE